MYLRFNVSIQICQNASDLGKDTREPKDAKVSY